MKGVSLRHIFSFGKGTEGYHHYVYAVLFLDIGIHQEQYNNDFSAELYIIYLILYITENIIVAGDNQCLNEVSCYHVYAICRKTFVQVVESEAKNNEDAE